MEPRKRRLLRLVQELRRGRVPSADTGPQVPRPCEHADGKRGQPVRQPRDEAVSLTCFPLLLVLSSSPHTHSYKNDPQIKAMTDLVDAYQRREVHAAEKILRGMPLHRESGSPFQAILVDNKATIMDDSFIKSYIGELLRSLRTQYLIDLIKPYTRLELAFLAKVRYGGSTV